MAGKLKKGKIKWIVIGVVIVAILIAVVVFMKNSKSSKQPVQSEGSRQQSMLLEKMDLTTSISATGTIESGTSKTISANVNGVQIKKVNVAVGDTVKKGDTLLTFDTSDLQEALSDAKENLSDAREDYSDSVSSAQDRLKDAKETYSDEKKNLDKKVKEARKNLAKAKKEIASLKKRIASEKNGEAKKALQEELTKAEESKKSAKNEYETAVSNRKNTNKQNQSNIESAEDSLKTAKSNGKKSIEEAKKKVEDAEESLESCSVKATIAGTVTSVSVEAGDMYNGGDILQIDDTSSFKVSTSVDEYDISSVSVGQRVVILTAATDEDELEGEITFIAPTTGSTQSSGGGMSSSSSDGYEIEIAVTSKDDRLRMGLTARCSIILEEAKDVYAVPYDAIHENRDGTAVIYVEDTENSGEQKEITVTKGMESDYYVEISGDELTEGIRVIIPTDDDVVTDGTQKDEDSKSGDLLDGLGGGGMQGGGGRPDGNGGGGGGPQGGGPGGR